MKRWVIKTGLKDEHTSWRKILERNICNRHIYKHNIVGAYSRGGGVAVDPYPRYLTWLFAPPTPQIEKKKYASYSFTWFVTDGQNMSRGGLTDWKCNPGFAPLPNSWIRLSHNTRRLRKSIIYNIPYISIAKVELKV